MKNFSKKRLLVAVLSVLLLSPLVLLAADFRSGEAVNVSSSETVEDDLYLAGGAITQSGNINGDFYGGGGNVLMNGNVTGDVVVGGGTVTLLGTIADDLRVGGGTITIQSYVGGDAIIGGGQVTVTGSIAGDVAIGGGRVDIHGPIGGTVRIAGGEVHLYGPVSGDVSITADKVVLGEGAIIDGNLSYRSPRQATISSGALVLGEISYKATHRRGDKGAILGILTVALLIKFLMLFVGALVLGLFFRKYSIEVVKLATEAPLRELGRGLLIFIVLPVVSVMLLVTIVGVPLGLFGLLAFGAVIIFSCLFAPVLLGSLLYRWLGKKTGHHIDWKSILLGAFVFSLISLIPLVGPVVHFLLMLASLGAAMRLKWNVAKEWR